MQSENLSFADLALSQPVLKAIADIGYETPSPIQAQAIPALLAGKDIVGLAQTGTGKTAAFALPLLSQIDPQSNRTQALILAPTRELAIQVAEALASYAKALPGFSVLPIYGGQDMRGQLRQLKRGAQVVVGTPGRVMDHLRRGSLDLSGLSHLVLDEADEMLRMGFIDDVAWILEHTPSTRQTALFSATMPKEIRRVAATYLREPEEIRVDKQSSTANNIEQSYWSVSGTNKLDALTRILEVDEFDGVIVFVRTKTATVELAEKLEARGYSAAAINGDMNQTLRERAIERLKNKKLDIMIATDVAARGIDVDRISHVINYDIPYDAEAYVHRIGRTGRAGRSGKAILFVAPREKRLLYAIEKTTGQRIEPMTLPSGNAVTEARTGAFVEKLQAVLQSDADLNYFDGLLADYSHASGESPERIAAALAYLLQKDRPLQVKLTDSRPEPADSGAKRRRPDTGPDEGMKRFRIEVGRRHGAGPGDIVGAIANEAGLKSRQIGQITLFDNFTTLDLPEDMPAKLAQKIAGIHVRGQVLSLSEDRGPVRRQKPKFKGKKKRA